MTDYPLAGFTLHQYANYQIFFTGWSNENLQSDIHKTLKQIFGKDINIKVSIEPLHDDRSHKPVTYSSDFMQKI
jgi:hypothetical protein